MPAVPLSFGSLFTGIGGIDIGLERAGMRCAWQIENDRHAVKVLEQHWPTVQRFGDIREVHGCELSAVDVLAGGFPCQPHTVAGYRRGSRDERDMWPEFRRIIEAIHPRWIIVENVPGVLSSDGGAYFGGILGDLDGLGFDAEWQVLSARACGAPHWRRRVFLVAYPAGYGLKSGSRAWHTQEAPGVWAAVGRGSSGLPWPNSGGRWPAEPAVGRMVDGFPGRAHRVRLLGNAVVPQVAEKVGRMIVQVDGGEYGY